jgi:hypothetical protein
VTREGRLAVLPRAALVVYVLGSLLAAAVALATWGGADLPTRSGLLLPPLSGFAALQSLAVCASVLVARRRAAGPAPYDLACFAAVSLFLLGIVTEYPAKTWDWRAYGEAAAAVADGGDPYTEADYLYPPPFAQAGGTLVRLFRLVMRAPAAADQGSLFVIWQILQFHAVLFCYSLARRLLHRVGLSGWRWTALLTALFVLNAPILRALRFSQPAFYTLLAALAAMLWADRYPCLAGLCVASAAYVKVYPAILLVPALLTGKRGLVLWTVAWATVLGVASVAAPNGREYWASFLDLLRSFPEPLAFRDNSVPGLVRNTARVLGVGPPSVWVARAAQVGIVLWLVGRMIVRRTRAGRAGESVWLGSVSDALCLGLLLSPTVWEHYFVFAIPAIIWVWRESLPRRPATVGLATVLTCLAPVFDVFPFSYHRLAGLILLAVAIPLRVVSLPKVPGADRAS